MDTCLCPRGARDAQCTSCIQALSGSQATGLEDRCWTGQRSEHDLQRWTRNIYGKCPHLAPLPERQSLFLTPSHATRAQGLPTGLTSTRLQGQEQSGNTHPRPLSRVLPSFTSAHRPGVPGR